MIDTVSMFLHNNIWLVEGGLYLLAAVGIAWSVSLLLDRFGQ
jgi:hypothetical protein